MLKGTYIFYEDGKEIYRQDNIITKFGKRFLTNYLANNSISPNKDMAFGIDNTSATVDDTRLGFEFYRSPITLSSADIQTALLSSSYAVVYKTTIPQDVSGTIYEIGLYPSTRASVISYDSKFLADFNDGLDWTNNLGNTVPSSTTGPRIGSTVLNFVSGSGAAKEYKSNVDLDLSGYSSADTIRLAYYKVDSNASLIKIKFYSSDTAWVYADITPTSGSGYELSNDILMSDLLNNTGGTGTFDSSRVVKIGIEITPTSGQTTTVGMDGLRINDEDTFDPIFGLISRTALTSPLTKLTGRQTEVEYRLDLGF